jgi:hypothetical protein
MEDAYTIEITMAVSELLETKILARTLEMMRFFAVLLADSRVVSFGRLALPLSHDAGCRMCLVEADV